MMEAVPLLSPEHTEELKAMVQGILEENGKSLEAALSEQVPVERTSILGLYQLAEQEWLKKQKIVDNLCHFSLTMMATIDLLWDQKHQHEERTAAAEALAEQLQQHIDHLGEENERCKLKINEAETHIESISCEKDRFEELYRSQSCCNFEEAPGRECCEHQSLLLQREEVARESGRSLLEKEGELSSLREEKRELEQRFQELMEEHQLAKMEIELAEIAVKDALSYRESSLCSRSILSRNEEVLTTRSQSFLNGELECFSNFDDSFTQGRKTLAHEFSQDVIHFVSNPELPLEERPTLDDPNLFKKKTSKKTEERRCTTEANEKDSCVQLRSQKQTETKVVKGKKTVSLQCNLLKNVPKIKLFSKKVSQQQREKPVSLLKPPASSLKQPKGGKGLSVSAIVASEGSLSRFFNFLSSKIITNRIRVK